MSYILDALRRAEAERERGNVPGLHAQAGATVPAAAAGTTSRAARWALPAIVGLGVAVAWVGWHTGATPAPPAPVAPVAPVVPAAPVERAPAPVDRPLQPPAPEAPRAVVATPRVAATKKRADPAASAAAAAVRPAASAGVPAERVVTAAELPDDIRRELPAFAIGGSIYSANPASRFVIVNGQLFHEGDTLAPGVVLEQIRLKSAVLSFRGYRYSVTF